MLGAAKSIRRRTPIPRTGEARTGRRHDTDLSLTTALRAKRGRSGKGEQVAWRRALFVCSVGALTIFAALPGARGWHADLSQWAQFWLLASLASATTLITVRGRHDPVHDSAIVFLVAGAIVLPPEFAPFVPIPACVVGALWRHGRPFLLLLHGAFTASLATLAASAIVHSTSGGPTTWRALLVATAAVAYVAIRRSLRAAFGRLGFDRRSRPGAAGGVGVDLVLVSMGVGVASLWSTNPWLIPILLAPLTLVQRLQRLPTLEQLALTDAKTGLLNMHVFGEALDTALARARAERRPLSLIVIDLDLLREINNQHGHLVGDEVIRGISDVLRQQIRRGDLAARFGGEEFLLALPDTPPDRALRIAERIRVAVASSVFRGGPAGPATRATLSAGVAAYPRDAGTTRALIHAGDLAVMSAKAQGRNRVVDAADLAAPRASSAAATI